MASSEEKRYAQSVKRRARNQSAKSRIKTLIKKVETAVTSGNLTAAEGQLPLAASALQKAGRKRILHPNTAARRIGRLSRQIHRSKSAASS